MDDTTEYRKSTQCLYCKGLSTPGNKLCQKRLKLQRPLQDSLLSVDSVHPVSLSACEMLGMFAAEAVRLDYTELSDTPGGGLLVAPTYVNIRAMNEPIRAVQYSVAGCLV